MFGLLAICGRTPEVKLSGTGSFAASQFSRTSLVVRHIRNVAFLTTPPVSGIRWPTPVVWLPADQLFLLARDGFSYVWLYSEVGS